MADRADRNSRSVDGNPPVEPADSFRLQRGRAAARLRVALEARPRVALEARPR